MHRLPISGARVPNAKANRVIDGVGVA